ncbi:hypothetical protein HanRHA438_Chr16g0772901 [Helianthus annuus]|nr:hypothetical protein HanRHA438_Chr16g0772901 [Helianthus annuus]
MRVIEQGSRVRCRRNLGLLKGNLMCQSGVEWVSGRVIVPICNYNKKGKTFVYEEEGVAVFKLYAVHTGHEPGPLDENARIVHSGFLMDQDFVYGTSNEVDDENFMGSENGDVQRSVLQQVKD